jgi:hypothetical protein
MADTFYREPTNHGDNNVYHDYVMLQLRCGGRGGLTMELYDSGGALYLSAGYAGIDDGVTKGTVERTVAAALSIAGVSAGTWCKVEVSVSGAAVTYAVSDIAGGTDESVIPAAVKAAYDYFKGGYYLTADKRLVGIAFKTAGGLLGRIINCESGKKGFRNIRIIEYLTSAGVRGVAYRNTEVKQIGDWNMDGTISVSFSWASLKISPSSVRYITALIIDDSGGLYTIDYSAGGLTTSGHILTDTVDLWLWRTGGEAFDAPAFSSTPYNRGWVTIEFDM